MMARPIYAANWKMNVTPAEAERYFAEFLPLVPRAGGRLIFFPPALSLAAARAAASGREEIEFGVQNIFWEPHGAFTGEISAPMAAAAGAGVVLVGHSERRHVFGETDEETARKVHAALATGLAPLLCVGETIDERRAGLAEAVVERQLAAVLPTLDARSARDLMIAYEPVWAIGTGETATPVDAGQMHGAIGRLAARMLGAGAPTPPVLYGGSVKPDNAADLLRQPGIGGLLVGGASLDPRSFARICAAG